MRRSLKRLLWLLLALPLFILTTALLYMWLMAAVEREPRSFWQSLEWATGTISTTGSGVDVTWQRPAMILFVATVQFAGIFLIFLVVPVFLVPFLEERFEGRLPRRALHFRDHVVIYRWGPAVESLMERLRSARTPVVVVETDERVARTVANRGFDVVVARDDEDALEAGAIPLARAVVANGRDEENAALILRARQMGFRGPMYALVEEPVHRKPMELAGATAAYTPRHIVAAALAARASARISPRIGGAARVPHLAVREMRLPLTSPLAGKTIGQINVGSSTGATIVGQWVASELRTRCNRSTRLEPGAILVVIGETDAVARAAQELGAFVADPDAPFIVAGFGEVGRKVHELLTDAGESVRVIEKQPRAGVDLVGSVLDASIIDDAGVARSQGIILALDNDDVTLFAAVILRDCAANVPIIARVNHARNVENIHRAGADFALSLAEISGQMLSHQLLGDRLSPHAHLAVAHVEMPHLAGSRLANCDLRERTGCSIVAVERGGQVIPHIDPSLLFEAGDRIYLCGKVEDVTKATERV
jgi:Trk K+ transport system NAD-binding subunit